MIEYAKYLIWSIGAGRYALKLAEVREVIAMPKVTELPRHHPTLKGVFNLRGKILSVADLRHKLACGSQTHSANPYVLAINVGHNEIGLVVDEVLEVSEFHCDEIKSDFENHPFIPREYISGVVLRSQSPPTLILEMKNLVQI